MTSHEIEFIWLSGRELSVESSAYGEVVVPLIALRTSVEDKAVIVNLPHGTKARFLEIREHSTEKRSHYKIVIDDLEGWIPETFASSSWSTFTFLGRFHEPEMCRDLDTQLSYAGMELIIRQNSFAVVTQGDPSHFDSIAYATEKLANRVASAQAPLSAVPLSVEFSNWVEVPSEGSKSFSRTVGFMPMEEKRHFPITNENVSTAMSIVPHMATVQYLDLALSDFMQALRERRHSLIFLARAIESIEYFFEPRAKNHPKKGKEKIMREELGLSDEYVDYVTQRANDSHRRHASPNGVVRDLPNEEFGECFKRTGQIIAEFAAYLEGNLTQASE